MATIPFATPGPGRHQVGVDPWTGLPIFTTDPNTPPGPGQPGYLPPADVTASTDVKGSKSDTTTAGTTASKTTGGTTSAATGTGTSATTSATGLTPEQEQQLMTILPQLVQQYGGSLEDVSKALGISNDALKSIMATPGYTDAEAASMGVSPEERAAAINLAEAPITGEANAARDRLEQASAARGGGAAGLNATEEEIARQAGRDASDAALKAGLSEDQAQRAANEKIAAARQQGSQFGVGASQNLLARTTDINANAGSLATNLLTHSPDRVGSTTGTGTTDTSGTTGSTVDTTGTTGSTTKTATTGTDTANKVTGAAGAPGSPATPGIPTGVGAGSVGVGAGPGTAKPPATPAPGGVALPILNSDNPATKGLFSPTATAPTQLETVFHSSTAAPSATATDPTATPPPAAPAPLAAGPGASGDMSQMTDATRRTLAARANPTAGDPNLVAAGQEVADQLSRPVAGGAPNLAATPTAPTTSTPPGAAFGSYDPSKDPTRQPGYAGDVPGFDPTATHAIPAGSEGYGPAPAGVNRGTPAPAPTGPPPAMPSGGLPAPGATAMPGSLAAMPNPLIQKKKQPMAA